MESFLCSVQKQPFADVLKNNFLKFSQYSRKTPVLKSLSNKVAALKTHNFTKKLTLTQVVLLPILQNFCTEHLWCCCSCKKLLWKIAVPKNSCSEKKLFPKIASLIDNLKVLHWKGTVPHNNYSGTNGKNLWGMLLSSFILGRTDYRLLNHRPPTQRLAESIIILERLDNRNMFTL